MQVLLHYKQLHLMQIGGFKMMNLKALVAIRKSKGLTQLELGEALGKDESTYSRIESGKVALKAKDLPIIAKVLGIPVINLAQAIFFEEEVA
jgi:transcriptional regulator with XRE-family HTH domain